MQTLSEIKFLLAERGLTPKHRLGQNFLHDHNLLKKLVAAAEVAPGDLVLEVGPGTGTLTEALLEAGARVVACELDRDLATLIRDRFDGVSQLTLVEGDCLASKRSLSPEVLAVLGQDRAGSKRPPFRLVANLPYQAASPLIATLLSDHPECSGLFVTIQREVGDRIATKAGGKEYGTLTVLCQALAEIERLAVCPPSCFWPQPKVTSAMLALRRRSFGGDGLPPFDPHALSDLLHRLFSKRRKQLGSILGRDFPFPEGINPGARPEQLDVEAILNLLAADVASRAGDPPASR